MSRIIEEEFIKISKIEFPLQTLVHAGCRFYHPGWSFRRIGSTGTLYYVKSGIVRFTLEDKAYICGEKSAFYLSREEVAIMENLSDTEKCELYFITFAFKDGVGFADLNMKRPLEDSSHKYDELFQKVCKTHLAEPVGYKIKEFYEFSQLIYEWIKDSVNAHKDYEAHLKIDKAVQYIKVNYDKNITVEELSRMTGYSVSHFRKLFVKTYGISPQEYMLDYKIHRAKELLEEEPEKSLEEVAELLGMCNASYFCKLFKNKTGYSPNKYKKCYGQMV